MKKLLLFVFAAFIWNAAHAQQTVPNSIEIKNNKHPEKEKYYKDLIYKADMENYRLKEKDVVLKFTEGFECVLLSAKSLAASGKHINTDSYQMEFPEGFIMPSFSISQNGTLIAGYTKSVTK